MTKYRAHKVPQGVFCYEETTYCVNKVVSCEGKISCAIPVLCWNKILRFGSKIMSCTKQGVLCEQDCFVKQGMILWTQDFTI